MQPSTEYSDTRIETTGTPISGRTSHDSADSKAQRRSTVGGTLSLRVGGWIANLFSWYRY
jgi:hypothetical protein